MRIGRIEFNIGYVVDLDNKNMVDDEKKPYMKTLGV